MLAPRLAPVVKVDIKSIVDPSTPQGGCPTTPSSPNETHQASKSPTLSHQSRDDAACSNHRSSATTTKTPVNTAVALPSISADFARHEASTLHHYRSSAYPEPYVPHHEHAQFHYPPSQVYAPYPQQQPPDMRMSNIPITYAHSSNKRHASPGPGPMPPKKKQSKWTAAEDDLIISLRGSGMKWDDVATNVPGRSSISCRLRFQNYLERRAEWNEEKINKLARLYERFKKDMWDKIAKEMNMPWRAAEAMHWQIGEEEMARRANVNVFHLAPGPQGYPGGLDHHASVSPPSTNMSHHSGGYYHAHTHSLPHLHAPPPPSSGPPPVYEPGRHRRNSLGPSFASVRPRADSARSMSNHQTPTRSMMLPPLGELGPPPSAAKFTFPSLESSPHSSR